MPISDAVLVLARRVLLAVVGVIATLWAGGVASAQPRPDAPMGPTIADIGSSVYRFNAFDIASKDGQRRYHVQVAVPKRQAPRGGFPVAFLLDGGAAVEAIDDDLLKRVAATDRPLVLVAIGYAGKPRFDAVARAFDYTPPDPAGGAVADDSGRVGGGADQFLALLNGKLSAAVARIAPIDRRRPMMWGHSYGGLLALHGAMASDAKFGLIAAASPALWWNYGALLREADAYRRPRRGKAVGVEIFVGGEEKRRPNGAPARGGPMRASVPEDAAARLAERLRATGLSVTYRVCAGASHGKMFALSMKAALLTMAGVGGEAGARCAVVGREGAAGP